MGKALATIFVSVLVGVFCAPFRKKKEPVKKNIDVKPRYEPPKPAYLTLTEGAAILGVSIGTIKRMTKDGRLTAADINGRQMINRIELLRFKQSYRKGSRT